MGCALCLGDNLNLLRATHCVGVVGIWRRIRQLVYECTWIDVARFAQVLGIGVVLLAHLWSRLACLTPSTTLPIGSRTGHRLPESETMEQVCFVGMHCRLVVRFLF